MAPDASTSSVDWSRPIEAVHEDGRTVPVKLVSERNGYEIRPILDDPHVANFRRDGTHVWNYRPGHRHVPWRIRNVQPTTPELDPALWDRMVTLVRDLASRDGACFVGEIKHEAQAIVADLPKPVDPDLLLARQCVIETLKPEDHRRCNCRDKIAAGEWDDGHKVRIALAAIAKARGTTPAPEVSHVG